MGNKDTVTLGNRKHTLMLLLNPRQFKIMNEARAYSGVAKRPYVMAAIKEKLIRDYPDKDWGTEF